MVLQEMIDDIGRQLYVPRVVLEKNLLNKPVNQVFSYDGSYIALLLDLAP